MSGCGIRRRPQPDLLSGVDAVVHLAGASIAGRFTDGHRAAIRDSRIEPTRLLAEAAANTEGGPRTFVSASAIGFYGFDRGDTQLTEDSTRGDGFLADVVGDWEAATAPAVDAGLRVVPVRTGIVQAAAGGTLRLLRPLFAAGLGGPVAGGNQWLSWIGLDDLSTSTTGRSTTIGSADPSTPSVPNPCATPSTPASWPGCCTALRCCRSRHWGRGCFSGSRAPASSPRRASGWCRRSCWRSVTASGIPMSATRWHISSARADFRHS